MGVKVTRNFALLTKTDLVTKDDMEALGRLARERIIRRTLMGVGPDGAPFAPYSAGYLKVKQQALGAASPVNLQVSGEMLRSIQVIATDKRVELTFAG